MTLFIDTSNYNKVTFALKGRYRPSRKATADYPLRNKSKWIKKTIKRPFKISPQESYKILQFLEKFLKLNRIQSQQINKIVTSKGPGSFTGLRVGASIAQALGMVWDIPVSSQLKLFF
jgi:hypothetical protein